MRLAPMKIRWIALTLCMCLGFACAKVVPMENPDIAFQRRESREVEQAIRDALLDRGWEIEGHSPGYYKASYQRNREVSAVISIRYDRNSVSMKYIDSSGLRFSRDKSGGYSIHRAYNRWLRNLEKDIRKRLRA